MSANRRQKPPATVATQPPPPPSPTTQATSKYTNKDGSKVITVPKGNSSAATSSQPFPAHAAPASLDSRIDPDSTPGSTESAEPVVNRKKQKRREKARAKAESEAGQAVQHQNGQHRGMPSQKASPTPSLGSGRSLDVNYVNSDEEVDDFSEDDAQAKPRNGGQQQQQQQQQQPEPVTPSTSKKSKKKKKKKAMGAAATASQQQEHVDPDEEDDYDRDRDQEGDGDGHYDEQDLYDYDPPRPDYNNHAHPAPRGHHHPGRVAPHSRLGDLPKRKIWDTSSSEERESIKEFWLGLGEDERKSLVKVEKDAVLRKMKEQQRQTCSCSVCGRKRTAIEEELEQLYDAYYQELENYAHRPNDQREGAPPVISDHPSRRQLSNHTHQPSHGRIVEHVGDDEDEDDDATDDDDEGEGGGEVEGEEFSDDDLEGEEPDDYSDDEEPANSSHDRADYTSGFLSFGKSLTVQGGILTVADDLLKNDGKKFIEMMEQLAEKRMQREEDAFRLRGGYGHPPIANNHTLNNAPLEEDEEEYDDDDDDDDEYEGDDGDEEYDSEDENSMSADQRMEEGRRMFQIFAARMFEQRVLHAYRDKRAEERRIQFLTELDQENKREELRKEKNKLKKQKEKEKQRLKKQEANDLKARKEEKKRQEEQKAAEKLREAAEQKRREREAQKKAEEEERLRKAHEQLDKERKAHEAKELEKKRKEEAKQKKEREVRERKEQQEREQKAQREQKEREAKARAEREARDKRASKAQKQGNAVPPPKQAPIPAPAPTPAPQKPPTAAPMTLARRPAQNSTGSVVPPPALPHQPSSISTSSTTTITTATATATAATAAVASPHIPAATPVIPLAPTPTPLRTRQPSQQEGSTGSSASHSVSSTLPSPHPMTPVQHMSPGPLGPSSKQSGYSQQSQQASPMNVPNNTNINHMPGALGSVAGGPPAHSLGGLSPGPPGFPPPPGFGSQQGFAGPLSFAPSSFSNPGMMGRPPPSRGLSIAQAPPGLTQHSDSHSPLQGLPSSQGFATSGLHQRHPSSGGGFDAASRTSLLSSLQPRPPPPPIARPGSVTQGQQRAPPGLGALGRGFNNAEGQQYGSSALVNDSEEVGQEYHAPSVRRNTSVPGPTTMPSRGGWPYDPSTWPGQASGGLAFSPPTAPPGLSAYHGSGSSPWSNSLPNSNAFGSQSMPARRQTQRPNVRIRTMVCEACRTLPSSHELPQKERSGAFVSLDAIKTFISQRQVEAPPTDRELNDILETLGDASNGGGNFESFKSGDSVFVRWVSDEQGRDNSRSVHSTIGQLAIGSPVVQSGTMLNQAPNGRPRS